MITLESGTQFGRYIINHQLGRGGMATVYRATDTRLQRTVALKIMAPALTADPEFVRRFEREAIMVANLHHPAIVTVYDVGEHDTYRYIAMEFIDGQSLNLVIRAHGAMSLGMAVSLLDPVAQALDFAHAQGAVHRDVKPHNIMVARDGRVLLTDFGIAQASDSERERLTRTGIFMGTPEYMSPEQAEGKRVDGRSDLYALGIVAFEVLSGRVPFAGNTPQLIVAHIQSQPPPVTRGVPDLPPETNAVISRMLAKQPAQRYPTGAAFIADLHRIARQHSLPLASRPQLAALALPPSSAGKPTILAGGGGTPTAQGAGVPPALAVPPAPVPAPASPSSASGGNALPSYAPGQVARRRQPLRPAPTVARPATTPGQRKTPSSATPYQQQSRSRPPITLFILVLLVALSLLLGFVAASARWGQGAGVPPTATVNVPTDVPPTPITPQAPSPVLPTEVPILPPPPTDVPPPPPTDVPPPPPTDVPPPPPTDVPPPPPTDVPPPPPTDVPPPPPTDVPPPSPTDVPPPPTVVPLPTDTSPPLIGTDTPVPTDTPLPSDSTTPSAENISGETRTTPTIPPLIATDTPEA